MRSIGILTVLCALLLIAGGVVTEIASFDVNAEDIENTQEVVVDVHIVNGYAKVWVKQVFSNPTNKVDTAEIRLAIPDGAFITNFTTVCNGVARYARIEAADVAQGIYDNETAAGNHTALVTTVKNKYFSTDVTLPEYSNVTTILLYEYQILRVRGEYELNIPFKDCKFDRRFHGFGLHVYVYDDTMLTGLKVIDSPYTMNTLEFNDSYGYALYDYQGTPIPQSLGDLSLVWKTASTPLEGWMASWADEEMRYFQHVIVPEVQTGGEALPKDIIFVLDTSGSMRGDKMEDMKSAFKSIVNTLPSDDNFNIITFNGVVTMYSPEQMPATSPNVVTAITYISGLYASGGTNINDAMLTSLDCLEKTEGRVPIVILLTDGNPTSGVTNTYVIRENVKARNTVDASVYTLGFGYDMDFTFLDAMALENDGQAIRIHDDTDAALQLTTFYSTVSSPVLTNVALSYTPEILDVVGTDIETVFNGSQIMVLGTVPLSVTSLTVRMRARDCTGGIDLSFDVDLEAVPQREFVKRAYYFNKLNSILDDITVMGELPELVSAATSIALEHGFVTDYTSLILTEAQVLPDGTELEIDPLDVDVTGGTYNLTWDTGALPVDPDRTMTDPVAPEPVEPDSDSIEDKNALHDLLAPILGGDEFTDESDSYEEDGEHSTPSVSMFLGVITLLGVVLMLAIRKRITD